MAGASQGQRSHQNCPHWPLTWASSPRSEKFGPCCLSTPCGDCTAARCQRQLHSAESPREGGPSASPAGTETSSRHWRRPPSPRHTSCPGLTCPRGRAGPTSTGCSPAGAHGTTWHPGRRSAEFPGPNSENPEQSLNPGVVKGAQHGHRGGTRAAWAGPALQELAVPWAIPGTHFCKPFTRNPPRSRGAARLRHGPGWQQPELGRLRPSVPVFPPGKEGGDRHGPPGPGTGTLELSWAIINN